MILLIDNYDSFTFNLYRYFRQLDQAVTVARNDAADLDPLLDECQAIVISPGPKAPAQAGRCLEIIAAYAPRKPILGICLGHQAICQAFGANIVRALRPMHGRSSPVELLPSALFQHLSTPAMFGRYHSLVAEPASIPDDQLQIIAWSSEREVMAVAHRSYPTYGVQFHPESVLSLGGFQLLANFLDLSGLKRPDQLPAGDLLDTSTRRDEPKIVGEEPCTVALPSQRYLVELP